MPVFYLPVPSAYGQNLKPSDGAKLYFYEVGTTTPKTTYSDPGETVAQAHPVVANSAGRFDAIFLSGSYKVVLTDKDDVTYWTEDNITGAGNSWSDQGDFDSSTNSGDYPATGNDNDVYRVTEEFVLNATSGSHRVFVGDFIKANTAGATGIDADWDIIKGVSVNINTVALTDQASIATNCKIGTVFTVTLGGNRTLANPTNKRIGQTYTWIITQDATGSRTLAFGTDFDFIGNNTIRPEASSITIIKGTCVSATSLRCELDIQSKPNTESKNLIFGSITNTTIDMDADSITFLSDSGEKRYGTSIDETYDITTDLMAGTTEKASHWYQLWLDSAGTRFMVPDLTGTADTDTTTKLVDSTATFSTDKVQVGDIVYNLTDYTQGVVVSVDSETTITLDADIFPDGDEDYRIHILKPTGLGNYRINAGKVYNDGSSNLTGSRKNGVARITSAFWHTVNGYGSSSTKIRKFTTEVNSSDDVVATIANSATLGFTITANMDCKLYVSFTDNMNDAGIIGISKNSSQLTTAINSITAADVMKVSQIASANQSDNVCWCDTVKKDDVIRPHCDGTADGSGAALGSITVMAEEII
jgi:hypothetical protein